MGENRRRLDADPFSTVEDLDESDDERLRSAKVLLLSVPDRRRREENRGRLARVVARAATVVDGMEEVLGRADEGRRREDADRDRFEEVLPLWAEVLVRWFAGLRR